MQEQNASLSGRTTAGSQAPYSGSLGGLVAGDKDCRHSAGVMTKLELSGVAGPGCRVLSPAVSEAKRSWEDVLSLERQGLEQAKGEPPTGGKPGIVGAGRA